LDANRVHFAGARVDRDDARLREHYPATANVHERVRRAEVHGHVAATEPCQIAEDAHIADNTRAKDLTPALSGGLHRRVPTPIGWAHRWRSLANARTPPEQLRVHLQQRCQRQADDVLVVAAHALHQRRAGPLDRVATRATA